MSGIEAWHIWIIVGILLVTLEIFTADFFLALIGIAALATSFVAAAEARLEWQLACFAVVSITLLATVRPMVKKIFYSKSVELNSNVHALAGQIAVVVETIRDSHHAGRVRLGSEEWRAISSDDSQIDTDSKVQIVQVDGATLTVKSLKDAS